MSLRDKLKGNLPQINIDRLESLLSIEIKEIRQELLAKMDIELSNSAMINRIVNNLAKEIRGEQGIQGVQGKIGDKGDKGDKGESIVGHQGNQGIQGFSGKDGIGGEKGKDGIGGEKGKDGKDGEKGKDGIEIEGKEIVNKVNDLPIQPDKQIDAKHIKNLPESKLTGKQRKGLKRLGGGGDIVYTEDLTSQTNGSTKTFTVPEHRKVILVLCPDAPTIYRPITDFTTSGKVLTLTSAVDSPLSQQTLLFVYVV